MNVKKENTEIESCKPNHRNGDILNFENYINLHKGTEKSKYKIKLIVTVLWLLSLLDVWLVLLCVFIYGFRW